MLKYIIAKWENAIKKLDKKDQKYASLVIVIALLNFIFIILNINNYIANIVFPVVGFCILLVWLIHILKK